MYYTAFCLTSPNEIVTVNFEATAMTTAAVWEAAKMAAKVRVPGAKVIMWSAWETPELRAQVLRLGSVMRLPLVVGRG